VNEQESVNFCKLSMDDNVIVPKDVELFEEE